jgi:hypothetical protein
MTTLVPPHGDPSLRLNGGDVLDLNALFLGDLLDLARAGASAPVSGDRASVLMRNAGAVALRDEHASLSRRLRGLAALLITLAGPDHGVRLRLDDLELATGSTRRSVDVLRAAEAPAPYRAVLERAVPLVGRDRELTLVIERDQQLPAAVWLAGELGTPDRTLRVTGRFATAYWAKLRGLPPFTAAILDPTPRGLAWHVVDPFGVAPVPGVPWRERAADPVPAGHWAGRVALRHILGGTVTSAHTVILGLCATGQRAVGRGGTIAGWSALAAALDTLRAQGTRVLAELWVGAPGIDLDHAAAGVRIAAQVVDRIAGFRVFDWPVSWVEPWWGGRPVALAATGEDLARQHTLTRRAPIERLAGMATTLARPLARAGHLVPGRIAAAYLEPPRKLTAGELDLDPDVVLGSRSTRTGKGIAVNLRTGACTTVDGALSALIDTRPPAPRVREVLANLPPAKLSALRDGDVLMGVS